VTTTVSQAEQFAPVDDEHMSWHLPVRGTMPAELVGVFAQRPEPGTDAVRRDVSLVIVDASAFTGPPQAAIELPARVPFGFHGTWVEADR
jgi:carotenoid cleavage dioxygenase-like enzyme